MRFVTVSVPDNGELSEETEEFFAASEIVGVFPSHGGWIHIVVSTTLDVSDEILP